MSERPTTAGNGAPAEAIEPIRSGTLRPTIRDVARAASVSVGTVSKALNNNGSLRQETRERAIAAAKGARLPSERRHRRLGTRSAARRVARLGDWS